MSLLPPPVESTPPPEEGGAPDDADPFFDRAPWSQEPGVLEPKPRSMYSVASEDDDNGSVASSLNSGRSGRPAWMDRLKNAEEVHFQMFPSLHAGDDDDDDAYTTATDTTFDETETLADDSSVYSEAPPPTIAQRAVYATTQYQAKEEYKAPPPQQTQQIAEVVANNEPRDRPQEATRIAAPTQSRSPQQSDSDVNEFLPRDRSLPDIVTDIKAFLGIDASVPMGVAVQQALGFARIDDTSGTLKAKIYRIASVLHVPTSADDRAALEEFAAVLKQRQEAFQRASAQPNEQKARSTQRKEQVQQRQPRVAGQEKTRSTPEGASPAAPPLAQQQPRQKTSNESQSQELQGGGIDDDEMDESYYDSDEEIWNDLRAFEQLWKGDTALPCMEYQVAVQKLGIQMDHETFNFLRDPTAFAGCLSLCNRELSVPELTLVMKFVRELPPHSVRRLRLSNAGLVDDHFVCVCQSLPALPSVEELWLDGNAFMSTMSAKVVADVLPATRIKHLNLGRNRLGPEASLIIATAARRCRSTCTLNLGGNRIGDAGVRSLLPVLAATEAEGAVHHARIVAVYEQVNPEKVGVVDQLLAKFNGREKELYDLLENKYGDLHEIAGVEADAPPALRVLDLADNGLTADGARAACELCRRNPHIASLHLGHNAIGDNGAIAVAQLLSGKNELTDVNLESNGITELGLSKLLQETRRSPNLAALSLSGNDFGSVAMNWLVSNSDHFYIDEFSISLKETRAPEPPKPSVPPPARPPGAPPQPPGKPPASVPGAAAEPTPSEVRKAKARASVHGIIALNKMKAATAAAAATLVMSDKVRMAVGEHSNALTQHSCDIISTFLDLCDKPEEERKKEAEAIISACEGRTEGKLKIHESTITIGAGESGQEQQQRVTVYMKLDYRSFSWQKMQKARKAS